MGRSVSPASRPVIVLLYLLKLKRRPVPVSTLMFWQRVLQESRRRAFFQRLRQLFSLLLHLLIFALILGALAPAHARSRGARRRLHRAHPRYPRPHAGDRTRRPDALRQSPNRAAGHRPAGQRACGRWR